MSSLECPDHTDGMPQFVHRFARLRLLPYPGYPHPPYFECRPPTNLAEELSQEPLQIWPLMSVAPPFIPRTSMCLAPRRGQFPLSRCAAVEFFLVFRLSTLRFCEIVQFASRRCVLAWQPILSTIRISGGSCHVVSFFRANWMRMWN